MRKRQQCASNMCRAHMPSPPPSLAACGERWAAAAGAFCPWEAAGMSSSIAPTQGCAPALCALRALLWCFPLSSRADQQNGAGRLVCLLAVCAGREMSCLRWPAAPMTPWKRCAEECLCAAVHASCLMRVGLAGQRSRGRLERCRLRSSMQAAWLQLQQLSSSRPPGLPHRSLACAAHPTLAAWLTGG